MSIRVLVAAVVLALSTSVALTESVSAQSQNIDGLFLANDRGVLRHRHSGLACDTRNEKVTLLGITVLDEFGREVACDYEIPNTSTQISIFVTQHNGEDVQGEIDRTLALIHQQLTANLVTGPRKIGSTEIPGMMPMAAKLNYVYPPENEMSTSIWVNAVNGWMVKVRATYSAEEEQSAEAESHAALIWVYGAVGVWSRESD